MGVTVDRVAGKDRYETSLAIANRLKNVSKIAVVNGVKGFSDAVSIAPVSARDNMAIVYASPKDGLNTFKDFLQTKNIGTIYAIGGTAVLSEELVSTLKNPIRVAGTNRNATNLEIIKRFYSDNKDSKKIELNNLYVTKNGYGREDDLIDSLTIGVLAAKEKSPVMIVSPSGLDTNQSTTLSSISVKNITKVGGSGNEEGFNQIQNVVNKPNNKPNNNESTGGGSTGGGSTGGGSGTVTPGVTEDVKKVINMINALDKEIQLIDKEAIIEARKSYDELDAESKKLVKNIDILVKAEAKIQTLENEATAKVVSDMIANLPDVENIKISDKDGVAKVRYAYNNLDGVTNKYVTNLDKLEALENKIAELEAKVDEVKGMLDALPSADQITIEHVPAINEFSTAYNKLTKEQQDLVGNKDKIIEYEFIGDRIEKAQPIIEMINNLPEIEDVQISDKSRVQEVRDAYTNLDKGVAKYVTNYNKLVELENKIKELEAKVDEVKGMLTALPKPEQVTIDDVSKINAFSTAYNKLTKEQQDLVGNIDLIIEYEYRADRIEKAQPVVEMIDALSIDNESDIKAARTAYNSLDKGAKEYVINLSKLEDLEKQLEELKPKGN